jgi:iron complex outermembrane receptor protein
VRLAYQHWNQQGFGSSILTGEHFGNDHNDDVGRISVKFDPTSNFDAVLKGEYTRQIHTGPMLAATYVGSTFAPGAPQDYALASSALAGSIASGGFAAMAANVRAAYGFMGPAAQALAIPIVQAAALANLGPCVLSLQGTWGKNCMPDNLFDNEHTVHAVLDMKWNIIGDITLRSITGVHSFSDVNKFDLDTVQAQLLSVENASDGFHPDIPVAHPIPLALGPDQEDTQWTQEFNLTGKSFDDKLDWLFGGFASWDKGSGQQPALAAVELTSAFGGHIISANHDQTRVTSDTWAIFSQEDFHVTKQLSVTIGGRYTSESIGQLLSNYSYDYNTGVFTCSDTGGPLPVAGDVTSCESLPSATGPNGSFQHATFTGVSYLASINYQMTPDLLAYFKTARGFRGGAFGRSDQAPAHPETNNDYELGFKGEFFEHRLRTNIAIYDTEYQNKQVSEATCATPSGGIISQPGSGCPPGDTPNTILANAATANIKGAEFEWTAAPLEGLTIYGTASYTYGYYTNFPGALMATTGQVYNAKGQSLGAFPVWQGSVGSRYEHPAGPGVAGLEVDYTYRGAIPLPNIPSYLDPNVPLSIQTASYNMGAVGLVNGRIDFRVPAQGLSFAFWITNIGDVKWGYQGITSAYTGTLGTEYEQPPRTFGFTVKKTFGGD